MTLPEFLQRVAARKPLEGTDIQRFMDEMSDRARRITCRLNGMYHTPEEVRQLLSELFGCEVDPTFRVFPPFYTDFGKNIHIGRNVFVNAGCHFQDHGGVTLGDGCLVGHNVVFATLDHEFDPSRRASMLPAPTEVRITIGGKVFAATLADNATARAFAALLPLTVEMDDLNGNEKYFYLDEPLPSDASRPGTIRTGDLMLYGSDCVVLFYETFSSPYSYTRIGRVADPSGLAAAVGRGSVRVAFER